MPTTHLIQVDANTETNFTYTDFATGPNGGASTYPILKGDSLSWIVLSGGKPIGYRIEFGPKNGSPFNVNSITVPAGGISPPQKVIHVPPVSGNRSIGYTVTLNDLRSDDPQVIPYDGGSIIDKLAKLGVSLITTIVVTLDAGNNVIIGTDPIPLPPGALALWSYQGPNGNVLLTVTFTNTSPFVNSQNPIPDENSSTTYAEQVDVHLGPFLYTVSLGAGTTPANGTFNVQAPAIPPSKV
jgi:hypothetical protein